MSKPLYGVSEDPSSDENNVQQQLSVIHEQRQEELSTHGYWCIYSNSYLEAHKEIITHH